MIQKMKKQKRDETLKVLTEARSLIEKGWTYREYARNKHGKPVEVCSPSAARFCALGAIDRVTCNDGSVVRRDARNLLYVASQLKYKLPPWRVNDYYKSKKIILDLYDDAINSLKGGGTSAI